MRLPTLALVSLALTACSSKAHQEAKIQVVGAGARAKCDLIWISENMASFPADCGQRVADEIERVYGPPAGSNALTTTQGITSVRLFWGVGKGVQVQFTPYYSDRDHGAVEIIGP